MIKTTWLAVALSILLPNLARAEMMTLERLLQLSTTAEMLEGEERQVRVTHLLMYFAGERDMYQTQLFESLYRLNITAETDLAKQAARCSNADGKSIDGSSVAPILGGHPSTLHSDETLSTSLPTYQCTVSPRSV